MAEPQGGAFYFAGDERDRLSPRLHGRFGDGAGGIGGGLGGAFEFGEEDAGEDEGGAGESAGAEAFGEKDIRGEGGEDWLEAKNDGGVSGRGVLLRPNLNGECDGRGEDGGDGYGE